MKRIRMFASLLAIAAVTALVVVSPASASGRGGPVPIQNTGDGLCLQPQSIALGAPIIQRPCNDSAIQGWDYIPLGGNSYELYNIGSGYCMYDLDGTSNGSHVFQGGCSGVKNERWDTLRGLPDITSLTSMASLDHSHCLDVPGGQPTIDLTIQIWQCNGTSAQGWIIGVGTITQS